MTTYSAYGFGLESDTDLPELRPLAGGSPRWTFETVEALEPMLGGAELGAERIYGEVSARLFRHSTGHRITVDDTGVYDISADGRSIRWERKADAWPDFVRAHLIGRVLATALYLDGWLPLHGSAVEIGRAAIAFLAPKGYGKSSLAYALLSHGARLLTDDTLAVELGPPPLARPGVHSLRVHTDTVSAVGAQHDGATTREGKALVTTLQESQLALECVPLHAIYLLDPAGVGEGSAAERVQLPAFVAAAGVVGHVKIARMLGSWAAGAVLDRCVSMVGSVPVFRLTIPRDLALLPGVAARVAGWHAASPGRPA